MASRIRQLEVAATIATVCLLVLWIAVVHAETRGPGTPIGAEMATNGATDVPKATKQHLQESYGKLPLSFEPNAGQTSRQVEFLSRGQGYTLFLTRDAQAVLVLGKSAPKRTPAQATDKLSALVKPQPVAALPAVVRIKLVGGKRTPQVEGLEEFPGKANYFIGNDPKKWRTNVPTPAWNWCITATSDNWNMTSSLLPALTRARSRWLLRALRDCLSMPKVISFWR